jgi:hypothetical protein
VRVVLDTNVILSAIVYGGLPRRLLEMAIADDIRLVVSIELLEEIERKLVEKFGSSPEAARATCGEIESLAEIFQPAPAPPTSRDPDDDVILATAAADEAQVIITGDQDLLVLGSYQGIAILTPRAFADLIALET